MTFLDEVLEAKRAEIARLRENPRVISSAIAASFVDALRRPGLSIIAEIKRRSPSKGDLARDMNAAETALAYAHGGAAAISCLTDRRFFGARDNDFAQVQTAGLPVLRKDFLIDEVQIDESVHLGASAVLLIARILPPGRLKGLLSHAASRGLDALVEVHDEAEVDRALEAGASIIGVNNRNLATLQVDPDRALRVRPRIPSRVVAVAESGVRTRHDVRRLEDAGFDAVLIGEALVKSADPAAELRELMGKGRRSHETTWIKVCGITSKPDAEAAIRAGVSAIGLVMTKSPRRVTLEKALGIAAIARGRVEVVGVFKDADAARNAHAIVRFDRVQFHGDAPIDLEVPVLRVVKPEAIDRKATPRQGETTLFDGSEGRGISFDWTRARGARGRFVIAGGLTPENVGEAVTVARPFGVDVSSGVEVAPGRKDPEKLIRFVEAVRRADAS